MYSFLYCFTAVNRMMDDAVTRWTVIVVLGLLLLLLGEVVVAEDGIEWNRNVASADFRDFRFPDQIESRLTKEVGEKRKEKS